VKEIVSFGASPEQTRFRELVARSRRCAAWDGNTKVNDTKLRAEPVWNPDNDTAAWRAIWSYSAKRARRDQKTLAAQEARARAIVAGEKTAKTARFVKTSGNQRALLS